MFSLLLTTALASPAPTLVPIPLNVPYFLAPHKLVSHAYCAQSMRKPLEKALTCVRAEETALGRKLLLNYGGCFSSRKVAGTNYWSQHAYGLAIDLNVPTPISRRVNLQHPALVGCFKKAGFYWGGDWANPDYMHFSLKDR
jgi:hypothetical protein